MKMTRLTSLILCLVFMICMFAGCSHSNNAQVDNKTEHTQKIYPLMKIKTTYMGETDVYNVGEGFSIGDNGLISEIIHKSETATFSYDDKGHLVNVNVKNKNTGKIGYEKWTYNGDLPTDVDYDPNNTRNKRQATIIFTKDANGNVTETIENNTFTDSKGKTTKGTWKHIFTYDANGRVTSGKYYSNNKLDHSFKVTYDANGNILVYSGINPSDNSEYLRVEFTYDTVEKAVTKTATDPFAKFYNFLNALEYLL